MNPGWMLIVIGAVMAVLFFLMGRYYSRITADRLSGRFKAQGVKLDHVHMYGRVLMYAAPLVFLLFLAFGLGWIPAVEPATF
jgi:hypothetical protein